jgi:hypothetical protein
MICDEENPPGIKNLLFLQVVCLIHFRLSPIPNKTLNISPVSGDGALDDIERVPGPPELSQDPSLHHSFSGFLLSLCSPKQL